MAETVCTFHNYDTEEQQIAHADERGALRIGGNPDDPADVLTRALISDSVHRVVRADASTHGLISIENSHHEIHAGSHFYFKDVQDLGNGANYQLLFSTPNTAKWAHLFFDFWHEQELTFVITEGVTVDDSGTPVTVFNSNRNSPNTPLVSVFHTPTNPAGGTVVYNYQRGTGNRGGGDKRAEDEIILRRDTLYLIQGTNATANQCLYDYHFRWYEHQDKD